MVKERIERRKETSEVIRYTNHNGKEKQEKVLS